MKRLLLVLMLWSVTTAYAGDEIIDWNKLSPASTPTNRGPHAQGNADWMTFYEYEQSLLIEGGWSCGVIRGKFASFNEALSSFERQNFSTLAAYQNSFAGLRLEVADNALEGECSDIAEFEYRYVIDLYPGLEASLLNHAQLGIDQIQFHVFIDQSDPRVRTTRSGSYEIKTGSSDALPQCVYKDKRQLYCDDPAKGPWFGEIIRTKDYDILPVYAKSGRSCCGEADTTLVVETRGRAAVIRSLESYCLECALDKLGSAAVFVKWPQNEVHFQLGRTKGNQVAATFRNGAITVEKTKLDVNEPLDSSTCRELYDKLAYCAQQDDALACDHLLMSTAANNSLNSVSNNYPGFSRGAFEQECMNACTTGKTLERTRFMKLFCHR